MPKTATKAAGNVFYEARCEAAKVNDRFASREGAAEELGIDRTRIARIELGSLTPYPEEALLMSEFYSAPQLTNQYCSSLCPIGIKTVPPCELLQLDRLAVKILYALQGADFIGRSILGIVADGEINPDKMPVLEQIKTNLEALEQVSLEFKLWSLKNLKGG